MEITPRSYQQSCVSTIVDNFFKNVQNQLIQMATGSGKTFLFSMLLKKCSEFENFRAIVLVPKNVLITQTEVAISKFISPFLIGVYNAGANRRELDRPITIASWQSFKSVTNLPKINLLIIDEVHRINPSQLKIYENLVKLNERMKLVGFTATAFTASRYLYGEDKLFKAVHFKRSIKQLTPKYLCPIVTAGSNDTVDVSTIKITAGDYNQSELEVVMTAKVHTQVKDALARTTNRNKVMWMCVSIAHAEMVAANIPGSRLVHSKTKDRTAVLDDFINGELKHVISVLVLSEGFDAPCADCLVLMRPTRSTVLYIQAVGRIARLHHTKENGLLLDYGSVVETLGDIYDIDGPYKLSKAKDRAPKLCPMCECHAPWDAKKCECGHIFKVMCRDCFEMILYGERCICYEKKERDLVKNLTLRAHCSVPKIVNANWFDVHYMNIKHKQSKKGNWMYQIQFGSIYIFIMITSWNKVQLKRFYDEYCYDMIPVKYMIDNPSKGEDALVGGYRTPKRIKASKDGNFWKLISEEF